MSRGKSPNSEISRFRMLITAENLSRRRAADRPARIARALRKAAIDLNPHQVEAAVRGLSSLTGKGLMLADEVGLGKTIEAGLILAQLMAEGRKHILVLAPASLRRQWVNELDSKLGLEATIVDGRRVAKEKRSDHTIFDRPGQIVVASHPFAARRPLALRRIPWDCVVIDEAHRLRGAHRGSKIALAIREALEDRPKLLLTATPLQNGLSELYGLLTLLDRDVLGPFDDFRRQYPDSKEPDSYSPIKRRISPLVQRTLRRQVKEYVRYTERRSMVFEFVPTDSEQRLYDEVTEYLQDEDTFAIHPSRRALMVMVYRKLLASSPWAIAHTLRRLANGVDTRIERGEHREVEDEDEAEIIECLEEDGADVRKKAVKAEREPTASELQVESGRLAELATLAESISRPAKAEALLSALDRVFTEAIQRRWPRKAVIFTESRRTQEALFKTLMGAGYKHIELLHGGSGGPDERANIVERFRTDAEILVLTEAGAEGLNLQFSNVVVNYDLPWNPQRIEQRIGRCHRYGQKRDVVVLNFLASNNAADARLYELLSQKLELFDGMFGATDDALGAMGDGAAFERKVFEILSSCRAENDIAHAFNKLQSELGDKVATGLAKAREQICDHFDDDVKNRLKLTSAETERVLDEDEAALVSLVRAEYDSAELDSHGRLHLAEEHGGIVLETSHRSPDKGADFLTVDHPIARELIDGLRAESSGDVRYVEFDYTGGGHKISRLAPLVGSEGWWLVYRVSIDGILEEDHLVHAVMLKTPDGQIEILDDKQVGSMMQVQSRDLANRPTGLRAATVASTHGQAAVSTRVQSILRDAEKRAEDMAEARMGAIELAFDERLAQLATFTEKAHGRWKSVRDGRDSAVSDRLFRELTRTLEREGSERERAVNERKTALKDLKRQRQVETGRALVATAYIWLS